ncbi:MAG: flagellar hook-length control protein FliK [Thiogranum sp.]|nr:flagellar hook-length control protein FliK [Thiogranum sp.]
MTAPVTASLIPVDGAAAALQGARKSDVKQSIDGESGGFGKLLGEALSELSGELPANADAAGQHTENLLDQLRSLPDSGKLLPLVNQLLEGVDRAAMNGDAQQILMEFNESLADLTEVSGSEALEAVAAALHQVVQNNPQYFGKGMPQQPLSRQVLEDIWQQLANRGPRAGLAHPEQGRTDAGQRTFDFAALTPVVAASPAAPAHSELAATLLAIRRLAGGSGARQDALLKSDAITPGSASLAPPGTLPPPAAAVNPSPMLPLGVPLHQTNWDSALGERIQWLISQGAQAGQSAQIKLNPAHLGPMEVRIQVRDDQATVQFTATHAVVREALEAALPRLREMLGASGVELVDVDISGQSFAEQQRTNEEQEPARWTGSNGESGENPDVILETALLPAAETGRLDLFV